MTDTCIFYLSSKVIFPALLNLNTATVGSPYNEGPKKWQNMFAVTRLFFMYCWGKENHSLYRGSHCNRQNINLFE